MTNLLEIKNISKSFGGIKALDSFSLSLDSGKITALIGPNGAGKSTLFEIISGLQTCDLGKVLFLGENILGKKDYEIARLGISRTFQTVRLFKNLDLFSHIEFSLDNKDEGILQNILSNTSFSHSLIREKLDNVGLEKNSDTLAQNLSYGQRKLLDLGIALSKTHSLLLLDEPIAGVNPLLRKKIKNILLNEKKKGKTILFIEHDMHFVMEIADIVYVMGNGKLIACGSPSEIKKNKKVLSAYLGDNNA